MKRSNSSFHQLIQRIPADIKAKVRGSTVPVRVGDETIFVKLSATAQDVRLSLRTRDPQIARERQAAAVASLERAWRAARSGPVSLSQQQCVALAGEMFRAWASSERLTTTAIVSETLKPGTAWKVVEAPFDPPAAWQAILQSWTLSPSGKMERLASPDAVIDPVEELEHLFGKRLDATLVDRGIGAVDTASRELILLEFLRALRDAFAVQKRRADGDFSHPPEANRFPEWVDPKPVAVVDPPKAAAKPGAKVSLRGLVDSWWAEAKLAGRSQSTHESYRATINRFATFVKHDDAQRVTNADVLRFKEHRIAAGASLKTVKDSDLVGLKAVFAFALNNRLVAANPADGVKVMRSKVAKTREQGFTAEEAKAILAKSLQHQKAANENPKTALAKRWVPWLCAYTGARVGEVVQLRKEDVTHHADLGIWTITITPEAGTVKNKEVRRVVLHEHLVEQGFPELVKAAKAGPLFLTERKRGVGAAGDEDMRGKWRATKNRLAEFAREVVPDERVKPNHGWRHRFRTVGREAGVADSILDAVGGWAAKSVGERYGDVSLAAQAKAFEKFPRFAVEV